MPWNKGASSLRQRGAKLAGAMSTGAELSHPAYLNYSSRHHHFIAPTVNKSVCSTRKLSLQKNSVWNKKLLMVVIRNEQSGCKKKYRKFITFRDNQQIIICQKLIIVPWQNLIKNYSGFNIVWIIISSTYLPQL